MTIVSIGRDEQPSERDRQVVAVMSLLEDSLESDDIMDTYELAEEIIDCLLRLAGNVSVNANAPPDGPSKPRIRVPAIQIA